MKVIVL